MSESVQAPVGQTLREAREARGLSLDAAAVRLRLMQRQVEAMESEDFDSLGQPVFARGFVRNYARLLDLAPEPLLASMGGAASEPVVISREVPPPSRNWLSSPWLLSLLVGLLVLAASPVALYWWLNSEEDEAPAPAAETAPPARVVPAPAARAVEQPASPDAPVLLPEAPPALPVDTGAAVEAGAPAAPAATVAPAAPITPATPAAPTPVAPAAQGVLQLDFGAESWVEIRDASGRMLHRQLNLPGSRAEVRGNPPFDVVIGNAAQVQVSYNGRPIDLKPFIEVTVARFTLEE